MITCYTVASAAGEFNCLSSTPNFDAATIEECCVEGDGYFFEGGGYESCQACIGMENTRSAPVCMATVTTICNSFLLQCLDFSVGQRLLSQRKEGLQSWK